jgi:hypothetical protein
MTIKSRLATKLFGIAYRLCSDQVCSLIEDIGYIHEDYVYEYACDNYDPYC